MGLIMKIAFCVAKARDKSHNSQERRSEAQNYFGQH
jgi:hypothetical protein